MSNFLIYLAATAVSAFYVYAKGRDIRSSLNFINYGQREGTGLFADKDGLLKEKLAVGVFAGILAVVWAVVVFLPFWGLMACLIILIPTSIMSLVAAIRNEERAFEKRMKQKDVLIAALAGSLFMQTIWRNGKWFHPLFQFLSVAGPRREGTSIEIPEQKEIADKIYALAQTSPYQFPVDRTLKDIFK